MARAPTHGKSTLDVQFRFADTAFPGGIEGWNSKLCFATGVTDGERYLLRLFKKTGTALDEDIKRLITRGLRRVRRVLSSRRARQLLVEVLEIVEDQDEARSRNYPMCENAKNRKAARMIFLRLA